MIHEHRKKETSLCDMVEELRDQINKLQREQQIKENQWKGETELIQIRLKEAEERSLQMHLSVEEATKPLLRQIEALVHNSAAKANLWEEMESSLKNRLTNAEEALRVCQNREKQLLENIERAQNRIKTQEMDSHSLSANIHTLTSQLEILEKIKQEKDGETVKLRLKIDSLTDEKNIFTQQWNELQSVNENLSAEISILKSELNRLHSEENNKQTIITTSTPSSPITPSPSLNSLSSLLDSSLPSYLQYQNMSAEKAYDLLQKKHSEVKSVLARSTNLQKMCSSLQDEIVSLVAKNESV